MSLKAKLSLNVSPISTRHPMIQSYSLRLLFQNPDQYKVLGNCENYNLGDFLASSSLSHMRICTEGKPRVFGDSRWKMCACLLSHYPTMENMGAGTLHGGGRAFYVN